MQNCLGNETSSTVGIYDLIVAMIAITRITTTITK